VRVEVLKDERPFCAEIQFVLVPAVADEIGKSNEENRNETMSLIFIII
jgi:hypothetical protein